MAVIARGSVVTNQAGGTVSGNWSVSTPSATQTGDYLLLLITCNGDTVTPASGWTLLRNGQSGSLPSQSLLYGKTAVAADAGGRTYTWNLSNTTPAPDVAVCWAFGNVDTAKIVSAISAEDTASSATSPAVTTTVPSLMVHLVADRRGSTPAITWTYPGGRTKTEGTNDGSVGYTASGAPNTATTSATGSQSGISITGSASPSTSFAYQVGLGDALVQVAASDSSTNIIDAAAVQATLVVADTGTGADTAAVRVPVPVTDTGTGVDAASKITILATESATGDEATKVVSGGSTLAFASDVASSAEVAPVRVAAADSVQAGDVQQAATVGIQGPLPPGPRIARVKPATNG